MDLESKKKEVFNKIVDVVVEGEHSPYNEMMEKTKDIDIDFFEKINRGINTLSDELNLDLKDKVVDAFSEMADSYFVKSDLEARIITMIRKEAAVIKNDYWPGDNTIFLNGLAEDLKIYASCCGSKDVGFPRYTLDDVMAMYQDAKHVSIKEFFMRDNGLDILDFYSALMDYTWWACRLKVANKTSEFILNLSEKISALGGNFGRNI